MLAGENAGAKQAKQCSYPLSLMNICAEHALVQFEGCRWVFLHLGKHRTEGKVVRITLNGLAVEERAEDAPAALGLPVLGGGVAGVPLLNCMVDKDAGGGEPEVACFLVGVGLQDGEPVFDKRVLLVAVLLLVDECAERY